MQIGLQVFGFTPHAPYLPRLRITVDHEQRYLTFLYITLPYCDPGALRQFYQQFPTTLVQPGTDKRRLKRAARCF
jgi:hypothetical protein